MLCCHLFACLKYGSKQGVSLPPGGALAMACVWRAGELCWTVISLPPEVYLEASRGHGCWLQHCCCLCWGRPQCRLQEDSV
jgi:hypothetical protein